MVTCRCARAAHGFNSYVEYVGMTANRKDAWRDIAASVADQIADNIRNPRRPNGPTSRSGKYDEPDGRDGSDEGRGSSDRTYRRAFGARPSRGWGQPPTGSEISGEFKRFVSASVRATTESINDRREDRVRRRPVRRLRKRQVRQTVAAGVLGLWTLGGISGVVAGATQNDQAEIIVAGTITVAAGAGVGVFGTRARKTRRRAEALESKLSPISLDVSSYEEREEPPQSLPPTGSVAYQPIRKLRAQRRLLQQLLPDLKEVAPDISSVARESEQSLERHAQRAVLLERTIAETGEDVDTDYFSGIRASLDKIVQRLEDGVAAHERLVAGAASVVAELDGTSPEVTPVSTVREAADGLHALAEGLREVSSPTAKNARPLTGQHDVPVDAATVQSTDVSLPPSYGPPKPSRGSAAKPHGKSAGKEG